MTYVYFSSFLGPCILAYCISSFLPIFRMIYVQTIDFGQFLWMYCIHRLCLWILGCVYGFCLWIVFMDVMYGY